MITIEQLEAHASALHIPILETTLDDGLKGYWDADERIIVLDSTLSRIDYKCTLAHELTHASLDDASCTDQHTSSKQERRCRELTARLLISVLDYARAELMYDAHIALIASELDVTRQIVCDYQRFLARTQWRG
ncbi:hypothetical protein B9G54_01605 [Alloscardovia macacae]|uniref:IrrE N-terminal-like domain-containing protein n=1 Tax=Alloscardovia macacae TaxID=1160091 RepID=A0A1Y2T1V7_9BIFI|nr:ImmA/IrrE family metallo-endopeptidase [Alloscardovia macacae]OTA27242.1 hypothetical protein B9G54_01605 [Alloscardovia macacae]OTA29252.1 hypothetical protein B9T39_03800 [Alloscardovia macacae]